MSALNAAFHDLVPVQPRQIGVVTVQAVNARQLHAALAVGRDFSNWIKGRIDRFGFVEGQDYVTEFRSPELASGNRGASVEYHLSIDMGKELAMVENNDRGREVRRYFLACERMVREMLGANGLTPQVLGGIVKGVVNRAVDDAIRHKLPEMVGQALAADPRAAACEYRRAIDVVTKLGAAPKGRRALSRKAGNRMDRLSKAWGVVVKLSPENGTRMFSAAVIDHWEATEGRALVRDHNAKAIGQGLLRLVAKSGRGEPA